MRDAESRNVFKNSVICFKQLSLNVLPVLAACFIVSAKSVADGLRGEQEFKKNVLPALSEYCYDCHGEGANKGGVKLDGFKSYTAQLNDRKFWNAVREHVSLHIMPPEGKPKPSMEQRDAIVQWIDDAVMWVDPSRPDPGHITLRRLNRSEYNNSVRDIFFTDIKPADNFPADDTGYGFDNIGEVLSLSPLLMEKYLISARQISEDSIWTKAPDRIIRNVDPVDFHLTSGKGKVDEHAAILTGNGEMTTEFKMDHAAPYNLTVELSAQQIGHEKARYALLLDGKIVATGEIKADINSKGDQRWQRISGDVHLLAGTNRLAVRFLNEDADPGNADPKLRERHLHLRTARVTGPLIFQRSRTSKFIDWVFEFKNYSRAVMRIVGEDFNAGGDTAVYFNDTAIVASNGFIHRQIEVPAEARYDLHVIASGDQAGDEPVKMRVQVDAYDWGVMEVKATHEKPLDYSRVMLLTPGKHDVKISFLNDFYEKGHDRNLVVHELRVLAPSSEGPDMRSDEFTRRWVARVGLKMFRRSLDDLELQRYSQLALLAYQSSDNVTGAVRLVCETMLCSPKFLFRGAARPGGPVENGTVRIDEFSLASRLSYFLWSSCPDDLLLSIASRGELRKNLPKQVQRMIADAKGWALTEDFAGQWLQLRDVGLVSPDKKIFPEFSGKLALDMKKESQLYFDHILRANRSVLEFLDSDYSFLNERLSKFYEIPGVDGKDFRKVSLVGTPRGGILTQGGILTLTSHPTRTSPVKRGKFLLENILATPPPPPPQNVPAFKEDRGAKIVGTLRQRFEAHRADPSCASCHAFLDPLGFAFEHFDAIGRWREKDNSEAIDATGQLLSGQKFDGVQELRKMLVQLKKKDFTRSISENLLVYALGRGLDYTDRPFEEEIMHRAEKSDYKFQDIILAVAVSVPFQKMRASDAKPVVIK